MSRRVFYFDKTWKDRQFQKDFSGLRPSPKEQDDFLDELKVLIAALENTPHPATDPTLRQKYKAKSYRGVIALKSGNLIEYSLGNLTRVIAKFPARTGSADILLIVVTIFHEHERIKRLLKLNRSHIENWEEDDPGTDP